MGSDRPMRDRFPGLCIDEGRSPLTDLVRQSFMCIYTYNGTTYLESLSMNVPTVIFWNPAYWELHDSAVPYFEELKRVGIFHQTPESAAPACSYQLGRCGCLVVEFGGAIRSEEVLPPLCLFTQGLDQ